MQIPYSPESLYKPAILSIASWMISDTIMEHTCASAYKSELGRWIVCGDRLSETYMKIRVQIVEAQLIKLESD